MKTPVATTIIRPIIKYADNQARSALDEIIVEQSITLLVDSIGSYTLLCSPSDLEALVIGFLFSEGLIKSADDIINLSTYPDKIVIQIEKPSHSCELKNTNPIKKTAKIAPQFIYSLIDQLQKKQQLFQQTGGTHAAGIFDTDHNIIAFAEDIGRHNAMDKAIGKCLINHIDLSSCGVVLSSRISFEMVAKTARAKMGIMIAVSAPTSLAIETAEKWNITLIGFARNHQANCYNQSLTRRLPCMLAFKNQKQKNPFL